MKGDRSMSEAMDTETLGLGHGQEGQKSKLATISLKRQEC